MSYRLGIDLGTTYSAAALERAGAVAMVPLGNRSASIPSAVCFAEGALLVGEAASARSVTDAKLVAREFKRRIGDPTPLLGERAAHELSGLLCAGIVRAVETREGAAPSELILTYPAGWTAGRRQLFVDGITSAADVDWPPIRTVSEPEAAAMNYALNQRMEPGAIVAVYDLGGGTFDAAVLRRDPDGVGFELIGQPEGIDRLGGIDFDAAVLAYVNRHLDGALSRLDGDDPSVAGGLARLRSDCTDAKQALSTDTDVRIPVLVPGVPQAEVRITRGEFETMIQPALGETIGALRKALRSAGVSPRDIEAVLLVGGSSRIPLVAQLVGAELGRPVAVDAHPKHGVSLGAALCPETTTRSLAATTRLDIAPTRAPIIATAAEGAEERVDEPSTSPIPVAAFTDDTDAISSIELEPDRPPHRKVRLVAAAAALAVAAGVGIFFAVGREPSTLPQSSASTTVAPSATSPFTTSPSTTSASPTSAPIPTSSVATTAPTATSASPTSAPIPTSSVATTAPGQVAPIPAIAPDTLPTDCRNKSAPFVCITVIGVDEDQNLIVPFVATGYEPIIGSAPNRHVHFYFKVGPMAENQLNAGTNGPQPGDWVQWDAPNPMGPGGAQRGYTVSDARDVKATELCVLVASHAHAVVANSGNCLPLPAAVIAS